MQELKQNLNWEFEARLEDLGAIDLTSEEYKRATESVTKIADRIIEIEKIEAEQALKAQQAKDEKRDKVVGRVMDGVKFVGGSLITIGCFVAAMNFEKEGTLTTQGGRNALSKLLKFNF
jgi:hypothetical protein